VPVESRFDKSPVAIGLSAAIVSVREEMPVVLTVAPTLPTAERGDALPYGPFSPTEHRTLDVGLRAWVAEQTPIELGYVEQLYTFGDRGRHARPGDDQPHVVSIGYLALTRAAQDTDEAGSRSDASTWRSWYDYFPWEDWRRGKPDVLNDVIEPSLATWAAQPNTDRERLRPLGRSERIRMAFAMQDGKWDEERVLDRYELLYEAGLVAEARRDGAKGCRRVAGSGEPRSDDALRSPPHSRDRDWPPQGEDQISPGGLRTDAGRVHAVRTSKDRRGDPGPTPA
jgi:hypothetical protein